MGEGNTKAMEKQAGSSDLGSAFACHDPIIGMRLTEDKPSIANGKDDHTS